MFTIVERQLHSYCVTAKQRRTQRPYSPRARRFVMLYLLVCEMELPRFKVGVGHGVQLGKGLAGSPSGA